MTGMPTARELLMLALQQECPKCEAQPPGRCRDLGNKGYVWKTKPHPERYNAALKARLKED